MKKMLSVMVLVAFFAACGGGGDSCDFDVLEFTNGATEPTTESYWSCIGSNSSTPYAVSFYEDGTGYSTSNVGAFTWSESGCNSITANTVWGVAELTNIQGSIASGIATFDQRFEANDEELSNSCVLVNL